MELVRAPRELDLDRLHVRKPANDLRARVAAQRTGELLVRVEPHDGAGRCAPARRSGWREDRGSDERCGEEDEQTGDWAVWKAHPGGTES
jgi:hypothetical protein